MGIRAYLFGIIAVCTIGGLTLSAVLHTWFQKLEYRHSAVGESALTLKEISYASDSLASLRITASLVIEKGDPRLAESAIIMQGHPRQPRQPPLQAPAFELGERSRLRTYSTFQAQATP
ncbi:MAG: hypothetical protein ACI8XO_003817 [Verrucomicrobiales bacterium]|jgi:hypothetical protein